MEHVIESLLRDFEEGKMNRRQLIRSLAVTASAASVIGVVPTALAAGTPLKTVAINHISYRVADASKSRDFYAGLLGMKVLKDTGTKCYLSVGGIGFTAQPGEDERTRRTPVIDHIAYNVDNSKGEILAALKDRGLTAVHGINHPPSKPAKANEEGNSVQVLDPDGFHVTLNPKK